MTALVRLPQGSLRGTREHGAYFFGGVPYGAPPVGPRRFRPPVPPSRGEGERRVDAPGPASPQVPCFGVIGEVYGTVLPQGDDCLNLTIRTPELGAAGLPVLVWLHGGGFAVGSGGEPLYQQGAFARDGVVEVSVTYRLGVDGFVFLDQPGRDCVANLGLQDQLRALRWVHEHIHHFGGDASRVTLAGHSAGAMSVACLLSSPATAGLVHQAIIQSAAAPLALSASTATRISDYLAQMLGIPAHDVDALAAVPRDRLLEAQRQLSDDAFADLTGERFGEAAGMAFTPVIDGEVLAEEPLAALGAGRAAGIPTLIGTCRDEAMLMLDHALGGEPPPDVSEMLLGATLQRVGPSVGEVLDVYRHDHPGASSFDVLAAVTTDLAFRLPTTAVAEALANHAEVFAYRFDRPSDPDGRVLGAVHGAELPFVFGADGTELGRRVAGTWDGALANTVHGAWVSFIETGRPASVDLQPWPEFSTATRTTVLLAADGASDVVSDPGGAARRFWELQQVPTAVSGRAMDDQS